MNALSNKELSRAKVAIHAIAMKNGTTDEAVRDEMTYAIESGYNNPDPSVQAYWRNTPFSDRVPTPEEFMLWYANQL